MTLGNTLRRWFETRQHNQRFKQLLAGRDRQRLLEASPFKVGWWQGEDGYRVFDTRKPEPETYIAFNVSREEGEQLCIQLYLQEQQKQT